MAQLRVDRGLRFLLSPVASQHTKRDSAKSWISCGAEEVRHRNTRQQVFQRHLHAYRAKE